MNRFNYTLVADLGGLQASGDELHLSETMAIRDSELNYFRNIRMSVDTDGQLTVVECTQSGLDNEVYTVPAHSLAEQCMLAD